MGRGFCDTCKRFNPGHRRAGRPDGFFAFSALVALLVPLMGAPLALAGDGPADTEGARLTFRKVLVGSIPEYVEIKVDSRGTGTCDARKLADPPDPRPLKLSTSTTERLFGLARTLNYFEGIDLESHKRVANLGQKTFLYERQGKSSRAEFNYTQRREAQELTDLFEGIVSVEEHIQALEYSIKYDHLNLPRELQRIQIDLDHKTLADPRLMVPQLVEISHNPRFLHLAQVRAQDILQRLQTNAD